LRDIDKIWSYIAKSSEDAADRVVDEIRDTCRIQPLIGEACAQYGKGMRRITVGSYVVFYRAFPSRVSINRVFHGARDIYRLFK
jgi:toxin ParE1/3/4